MELLSAAGVYARLFIKALVNVVLHLPIEHYFLMNLLSLDNAYYNMTNSLFIVPSFRAT